MAETKGLIIVHTGEGKGKTTAALGLALRAWGDGLRVLLVQFIKGTWNCGEMKSLEVLQKAEGHLRVVRGGAGFVRHASPEEMAAHRQKAQATLALAEKEMQSGTWDMILLDEVNYAISFGLLDEAEVLRVLAEKPPQVHLVLTGRNAKEKILAQADLVTEMHLVKHPFQKGIKAQKGIEF